MIELNKIIDTVLTGKNDSDKHLMLLYSLVIGSNSKCIIELGARNGTTTTPLLLGAKQTGGLVHSVDICDPSLNFSYDLNQHYKFYKEDSLIFLRNWCINKNIDLILIDDWHSYDHVKQELELLDKIVSPRTIILLHDLMYGDTCPFYHTDLTLKTGQWANGGPYRAVAELNYQFWEFATLPWNNGMTILRKKYSNKYKKF